MGNPKRTRSWRAHRFDQSGLQSRRSACQIEHQRRETARRRDHVRGRSQASRTAQQARLVDEKKRVHIVGEHSLSA